jgi:hypothetical protein
MYESLTSHIVMIDIPDSILSKKMNDKLLGYLNQRYKNKCLDNYLILRVVRILRQSMHMFNERNRIVHAIEFEAETLFYYSGDLLSCSVIYNTNGIIGQRKLKSGSDVTFTVRLHDSFMGLSLNDVIPVKVVAALCSQRGLIVQAVMLTEMDVFTTTFINISSEVDAPKMNILAIEPKKEKILSMFIRLFKKKIEEKKKASVEISPKMKTILFDGVVGGKLRCVESGVVLHGTTVVNLPYDKIVSKITTDYNKLVYMINNTEFTENVMLLYDNQ